MKYLNSFSTNGVLVLKETGNGSSHVPIIFLWNLCLAGSVLPVWIFQGLD